MIKVATSEQIKRLDNEATVKFNIPSIILMENAAIGVVEFLLNEVYPKKEFNDILILAGHGNNGGDGFAIARNFVNKGFNVAVVLVGNKSKLKGDAKINFDILLKMTKTEENLVVFATKDLDKIFSYKFDLVIDAMLGTGLNSDIRGQFLKAVKLANEYSAIKIAVDIPTGLSSDNGRILGDAFKADYTLTMGLSKIGLLINDGPRVSGEIEIIDISYPSYLSSDDRIKKNLIEDIDILERLPQRPYDSHKYSVGKVFAIAGSRGLTGAAIMSSEAALRSGCGGVLLATTSKLQQVYAKRLKEIMTFSITSNDGDYFIEKDIEELNKKIDWADVLMIGPGLGLAEETKKFLLRLLKEYPKKKKVIDADGINILSDFIGKEKLSLENAILTPHLGEFSRLTRIDIETIKNNIFELGSAFAVKYRTCLVLKGAPTIIFDNLGNSFINTTGNAGMATVGMGDVLTGIISGLYAQNLNPVDASICGVFLHGLAGDLAKYELGEKSLISSDVIKNLPKAFQMIEKMS